jgi:hypothetical protein
VYPCLCTANSLYSLYKVHPTFPLKLSFHTKITEIVYIKQCTSKLKQQINLFLYYRICYLQISSTYSINQRVLRFFHFLDDKQRNSERPYKCGVILCLTDSHHMNTATHHYVLSVTCAQIRRRGLLLKDATPTPNSNPEPVELQPPETQNYYPCMRIKLYAQTSKQISLNVLPKI